VRTASGSSSITVNTDSSGEIMISEDTDKMLSVLQEYGCLRNTLGSLL